MRSVRVDTSRVVARLKTDDGFGLIELLIAMVILNVALLAIVAGFSSGVQGIARAARIGTAGAIADRQMEQFRGMPFNQIGVTTGGTVDATYRADNVGCPTHAGSCSNVAPLSGCATAFSGAPSPCTMMQYLGPSSSPAISTPDNHKYRLDTYVWQNVPGAGSDQRTTRTVLIVVRDAAVPSLPVLARENSTYDCATGTYPGYTCP